jgi:hypothetical protein
MGQVVKQYARRQVVSVARRVVRGTAEAIAEVLARTGGGTGINTVYTKRLNATFRSALAALVPGSGHCPYGEGADGGDASGRVRLPLLLGSQESPAGRGCGREPQVAGAHTSDGLRAGAHRWTMRELVRYQVPIPAWVAPKRRGRPPRRTHQLAIALAV